METTVYIAESGFWNKKPVLSDGKYKFLLEFVNWNDYGYYTYYKLFKIIPDADNIFIANMKCYNGTSPGGKLYYFTDIRSFLLDIESAYRFLFLLTYEERMQLIIELGIGLVFNGELNSNVFRSSILRNINEEEFKKLNYNIMKIIKEKIDFVEVMKDNRKSINAMIGSESAQ